MGGTNYYIESLLWDILVSPLTGTTTVGSTTTTSNSTDCNNANDPSGSQAKNSENVSEHVFEAKMHSKKFKKINATKTILI